MAVHPRPPKGGGRGGVAVARLPTSEGNSCQLAEGTDVVVPTISYWGVVNRHGFDVCSPVWVSHAAVG